MYVILELQAGMYAGKTVGGGLGTRGGGGAYPQRRVRKSVKLHTK